MLGGAAEDNNDWRCTTCADHKPWLLCYVNIIKAMHVVVEFTGVGCVKVKVEVNVGGYQCVLRVCLCKNTDMVLLCVGLGLSCRDLGLF